MSLDDARAPWQSGHACGALGWLRREVAGPLGPGAQPKCREVVPTERPRWCPFFSQNSRFGNALAPCLPLPGLARVCLWGALIVASSVPTRTRSVVEFTTVAPCRSGT